MNDRFSHTLLGNANRIARDVRFSQKSGPTETREIRRRTANVSRFYLTPQNRCDTFRTPKIQAFS